MHNFFFTPPILLYNSSETKAKAKPSFTMNCLQSLESHLDLWPLKFCSRRKSKKNTAELILCLVAVLLLPIQSTYLQRPPPAFAFAYTVSSKNRKKCASSYLSGLLTFFSHLFIYFFKVLHTYVSERVDIGYDFEELKLWQYLHFIGDFKTTLCSPQQILLLVSFLEFLSRQRPCQLPSSHLESQLEFCSTYLVIGSSVLVDHFSNGLGLRNLDFWYSNGFCAAKIFKVFFLF